MSHFGKEEENLKPKKISKISIISTVLLTVLICGAITGAFFLGNYMGSKGRFFVNKTDATKQLKGIENVSDYEKLFLVRDLLYKYYDGEINEEDLVNGAIKGMTSALNDPYTVFMDNEKYKEFSAKSNGEYLGVGIEMTAENDVIKVSNIFKGGSAEKSDIKIGDILLKVNGVSPEGSTQKAASLIAGEKGTEVMLQLSNETKGEYEVTLVRDIVKIEAVESELIGDVGYMSISGFDAGVAKSFDTQLKALKDQGMKGLILDLRDNTGGYLDESIKIASEFIPKGEVVVSTIDKYDNKNRYVSIGGSGEKVPLVVLVNGASASASEVVSGALRDYKVATLVGTKTYGKGVVQDVYSQNNSQLQDGSALKVTTAKYYTPNGENIHKKGIEPDIKVEYPEELRNQKYDRNKDPQFQKALETVKDLMK